MTLVIYPRAAPNDRVRVWIGAFQITQSPALTWTLDQAPAIPKVLREISSVRPDDMLPIGANPGTARRAFTGVYEFDGLKPDTPHEITVTANGETQKLE